MTKETTSPSDAPIIDPKLLENLSESDRCEAIAAAEAAARAEERAERRALERAIEQKRKERAMDRTREQLRMESNGGTKMEGLMMMNAKSSQRGGVRDVLGSNGGGRLLFVSKKKREEMAKNGEKTMRSSEGNPQNKRKREVMAALSPGPVARRNISKHDNGSSSRSESASSLHLTPSQITAIKKSYLGESAVVGDEAEARRKQLERQRRSRAQKKITFKFEWDDADDTAANDSDPILDKSLAELLPTTSSIQSNHRSRKRTGSTGKPSTSSVKFGVDLLVHGDELATVASVSTKPLEKMTSRDWRIFRENYDIVVRGGRAPPPLRSFQETPVGVPSIHKALIDAIQQVLKYREPSPIQRQAIPIGLQRRDLIGIAETGSGKTAAFGIPLCHHILSLPDFVVNGVADDGPLALIMAPTRELALQIDTEIGRLLARQSTIQTAAIVGGQPIQQQAQRLRRGVHIVVGTPGRINDCIEMTYLVLNQCSYIVLDEADRMIDLGFAPQIEQILDSMGGQLKSINEQEAYEQEKQDLEQISKGVPKHRLTAMFSATMPSEVERIAKQYLRHPAVVSIGDQDSGKNARIVQRVIFLSSPSQKENALRDLLGALGSDEKVIVFVNEKRHADGVGRLVERFGRRCVVLHGGKTQEQREENLGIFRRNDGVVLVATDVAGRGLDINDVSHVINYDLPSRSIDNYCHRIGRTGRAGREGKATSFITDADEGIMAPLKAYLESTGMPVPDRLARHPAASIGTVQGGHIR